MSKRSNAATRELLSAIYNNRPEYVRSIIKAGVPYNKDQALVVAINENRLEIAEDLIDHGSGWADITLITAIRENRPEISEYLIKYGRNATWGPSVIVEAMEEDRPEIIRWLRRSGATIRKK